jgi:ubiquinone biosynthesis protein
MSARHPIFDYAKRILQISRVVAQQIGTGVVRRLRHQPVQGPILLREGLERIGGCFVKFGQILSLQLDTLPREYCDELLHLLDAIPPIGREEILGVFQHEFHASPEKLYRTFDFTPIAAASIGQAHKAELHDGSVVAVKVQRPGAYYDFHRDVLLMRVMVRMIFLLRIRSMYFMRDPVRELSTWTNDELDYRREAAHCDLLADNAAGSPAERIPKIYWEMTTSRILTMEFLEGPSVSSYLKYVERGDEAELEKLRQIGFIPEVYSRNVIENFLRDAFRFGVFHADMHPANILILPNNVVGYVDFGIVATLTPEARRKQIDLTLAYANGNADAIYREFLNICTPTGNADLEGMRLAIAAYARTWYEEPAIGGHARFRVSVTAAMMDLLTVARFNGVLVDREMIKYIRSTFLVDGLVTRLVPGFDIAESLRQFVENYLFEQTRRRVLSRSGGLALLTDLAIWMKTGPAGILRALDLFERREISLRNNAKVQPKRDPALRVRALAVAAVWAVLVLFLALEGGLPALRDAPFFAGALVVFMASWTLWMLVLLRRLAAQ